MVERFNGRIAEVLATRRYDSAQDLETTLLRYVWLYNHHLPQKALGHRCPMDAMKQWYAENLIHSLTDMATATPEHECRRVRSLSPIPSPRGGGERRESATRLSR